VTYFERVFYVVYKHFLKIHKFMMYLRQKRQLKNGTFPLDLKATRSVMDLWTLGSFFSGLRGIFW